MKCFLQKVNEEMNGYFEVHMPTFARSTADLALISVPDSALVAIHYSAVPAYLGIRDERT